jgi:hypothetical protein
MRTITDHRQPKFLRYDGTADDRRAARGALVTRIVETMFDEAENGGMTGIAPPLTWAQARNQAATCLRYSRCVVAGEFDPGQAGSSANDCAVSYCAQAWDAFLDWCPECGSADSGCVYSCLRNEVV